MYSAIQFDEEGIKYMIEIFILLMENPMTETIFLAKLFQIKV